MALGIDGDSTLQIIIKAVDQATGVFKSVQTAVDKSQRSFADTAAASTKFAVGLGVAATAAGGLGYAALKAAGDMEQTRISFETMLGSASKADEFMKQLVSFAKTTPFTLTGLNQASKQLLAYGFAQEEVIPNLKALGDIASGVGMDKLPNLILAFGQVKAATRLTGMELRQFTEAGVPLLGMLAEQLGKPVSAIQEMVSAGEIGFPAVEQALKSLTSEGGRFNNLMEKQSHSLGGMVSNLQDAWNLFLAGEGAKLLDWAKKFVEIAQFIITNVLPAWIAGISALVDFFNKHQTAIYVVAGAIMGALVPSIIAATVAFGALLLALLPWIIGGAVVGGLVAGIVWVSKHWHALWGGMRDFFMGIWAPIKEAVSSAFDFIAQKIQSVIDLYNRLVSLISKPVKAVGGVLGSVGSSIGDAFSSALASGKGILQFEQGGIVPGPVGSAVPIIAHGQETILSANRTGGGSQSVYQVVIQNPQVRSRADVDYMREQIEAALRDVTRGHKLAVI